MIFSRLTHLLPGMLLLGAIALRWIFPEADPVWWLNIEDLHDEAWWAENARRKILFDTWMWDEYAGALASGPLATLWHYSSFSIFGIGFFQLRLISLIPATLVLLLLWLKNPLKSHNNHIAIALLCGSTAFFALNKVGYLEPMLILILIGIILCFNRNHWMFGMLAGLLMAVGLLFKGSFIFLLAPVLIWQWLGTNTKNPLLLSIASWGVLSLAVVILYFIPNYELFLPYYEAFKGDYLPSTYLYDPRGWIARLIWLPEKDWVSAPFACYLSIYFLAKLSRGSVPSFKSSAFGLFVLVLAFALLTDFSNRRLVPLMVLLPFVLVEKHQVQLNAFGKMAFGIILCLPAFAWCMPFFPSGDWDAVIQTTFNMAIIFTLALLVCYMGLKMAMNYDCSLWILRLGILIWSLTAMHYSALKWMQYLNLNYSILMVIQAGISLLVVMLVHKKGSETPIHRAIYFPLALVQVLFLVITISYPSYSLRDTAQQISEIARYEERITGPNNAVELAFLSKGKTTMFHEKDTNNSFNLYLGYLSKDHTLQDVKQFSEMVEKPSREITFNLFPRIHAGKSEAYIVYSKSVFEKN